MRTLIPSAAFWRRPGAAGLAIAVVSLPLILLLRDDPGFFVALAALCIYPVIDVPRILGRPSWWIGAIVSALVWIVVFTTVVQTAIAARSRADDASLIFIYPFLLYWISMTVAAVVRLVGWWRGRPHDFGPRQGAIWIATTYALLVVVPATLGAVPVLIEKITGNTPGDTHYSTEGEVASAGPGEVNLRIADGAIKVFRLNTETTYNFRGPGWKSVAGPAGPDWLKPGQRIALDYAFRGGRGTAEDVRIWIERKGCAGDAKWTAALRAAPSAQPALAGTTWEGTVATQEGRQEITTFELLDDHSAAYQDQNGAKHTDAQWRQNGDVVLIEVNDCYAEYEGRIDGDAIAGEFSNEMGVRTPWTARRKIVTAQ